MMKRFLTAIGFVLMALPSAQAGDTSPPAVKIPFTGFATNVSLGLQDKVEMWLTNPKAESVQTEGTFGGTSLVGTFRAIGRPVDGCAESMTCLQFQGTLSDLESGGFAEGMYTTWSMTMAIDADGGATATYSVGPLPSYDHSQSGVLQLVAAQ